MSTDTGNKLKENAVRELALFLIALLFGMVLLPLFIYIIGRTLFGDYAGTGFPAGPRASVTLDEGRA